MPDFRQPQNPTQLKQNLSQGDLQSLMLEKIRELQGLNPNVAPAQNVTPRELFTSPENRLALGLQLLQSNTEQPVFQQLGTGIALGVQGINQRRQAAVEQERQSIKSRREALLQEIGAIQDLGEQRIRGRQVTDIGTQRGIINLATEEFRPIGAAPPKKPLVNVDFGEREFSKQFGEETAKFLFKSREGAIDAENSLRSTIEARQLLDEGVITGFGADFLTGFGSFLKQAGFNQFDDPVSNTQAFAASRAQEVGRIIKLFGSGTGLSDADREFATKAAAGEINLTEKALRRILDINEKASRNVIQRHNKDVKSATSGRSIPFDISVPLPGGTGVINFEDLDN